MFTLNTNNNAGGGGNVMSNSFGGGYMDISQIQLIGNYGVAGGDVTQKDSLEWGGYTYPTLGETLKILSPHCYENTSVSGSPYGALINVSMPGLNTSKYFYMYITCGVKSDFQLSGGETIGKNIYSIFGICTDFTAGNSSNARADMYTRGTVEVGLLHTDNTKTIIATVNSDVFHSPSGAAYQTNTQTHNVVNISAVTSGVVAQEGDRVYAYVIEEAILKENATGTLTASRMSISMGYPQGPMNYGGWNNNSNKPAYIIMGPLPVQISMD